MKSQNDFYLNRNIADCVVDKLFKSTNATRWKCSKCICDIVPSLCVNHQYLDLDLELSRSRAVNSGTKFHSLNHEIVMLILPLLTVLGAKLFA